VGIIKWRLEEVGGMARRWVIAKRIGRIECEWSWY
jgi:hypothetical protein